MRCRVNVKGKKIWVDADNAFDSRPSSVEVVLFRDGIERESLEVDANGSGGFIFPCLLRYKNGTEYLYSVDERETPDGYTKRIEGYDIINTLDNIEINGIKTWNDDFDEEGYRPSEITLRLYQNGVEIDSILVPSPSGTQITMPFTFGIRPFVDAHGIPYVYTIVEDEIPNYLTTHDGFNITNTLNLPIIPFTFGVTNASGAKLAGATFEVRKDGELHSTATSDELGVVNLSVKGYGSFEMTQSAVPAGYRENTHVYTVEVAAESVVIIDGVPIGEFGVVNELISFMVNLERLAGVAPLYSTAPIAWPLNGGAGDDLYMLDEIVISTDGIPVLVKWETGIRNLQYFKDGGGTDITSSYLDGLSATINDHYTVYMRFGNGYEGVNSIQISNLRNGTTSLPYLLLDYATAQALELQAAGAGAFTLNHMQDVDMLSKSYEVYEDIDMTGVVWTPVGSITLDPPYRVTTGYYGTFDGNDHRISNFVIQNSQDNLVQAFFRGISGTAVIKNLTIAGSIESQWASGIVGCASATFNGIELSNLKFEGQLISSSMLEECPMGGIVGSIDVVSTDFSIEQCSFDGEMSSGYYSGGIVGLIDANEGANVNVIGCVAQSGFNSDVESTFGGICSRIECQNSEVNILNCASLVGVLSEGDSAGIVGVIGDSIVENITIDGCVNRGNIALSGTSYAAGILAKINQSTVTGVVIKNCYNTGGIDSIFRAAGISANDGGEASISNCYNVGDVTSLNAGGISCSSDNISNCASIGALASGALGVARISADSSTLSNNIAFNGMTVTLAGSPKTLVEGPDLEDGTPTSVADIKTQATYTALTWDFGNDWTFGNESYTLPVLPNVPLELQPIVLPSHLI